MPMLPQDLIDIVHACQAALQPGAGADWSVKAGDLDWDCRQTLAHMIGAPMFYSMSLAMRSATPRRGLGVTQPDAPIPALLDLLPASATILARLANEAPPDARGAHPAGMADAEGFLAMAGNELLNHTYDVSKGLGLPFRPPDALAGKVLGRLFPWAPSGIEAWPALLWAAGRGSLPDRERQPGDWWVQCAPLSEWDGQIRKRPAAPLGR